MIEIADLTAGVDTDILVGKAIGCEAVRWRSDACYIVREEGSGKWDHFHPTTRWEDAIFAAEEFELFDREQYGFKLNRADGKWEIINEDYDEMMTDGSGPLVICKAILDIAQFEQRI